MRVVALLAVGIVCAHGFVGRPMQPRPTMHLRHACMGRAVPLLQPATPLPRTSRVVMQEAPFWENVGRFMRFGITSMTGLVAGLLSPFSAFLRTPTLMGIGAALLAGVLIFFFLTLQAMQAPPEVLAVARPDLPLQDPQMSSMLQDIYGQ